MQWRMDELDIYQLILDLFFHITTLRLRIIYIDLINTFLKNKNLLDIGFQLS